MFIADKLFQEGEALKKYIVLVLLAAVTVSANERVIYGDDNRKEIHEADAFWQRKADSTVALFNQRNLSDKGDGSYTVGGSNYGSSYNLCDDEPYREQQSAAFCSGSLVGHNLILTAGHCVRSQSACEGTKFVFGFGYSYAGKNLSTIKALDIYSCKKLLARKENSSGADYAVIELDRSVLGHEALEVNRGAPVIKGDELVVIGHPAGIPTKVADGASVRQVKSEHFQANKDTYGGNSGSAVFNAKTGLIEGVLVRGAQDFIYANGCRKSNVCPNEGCYGEDVTRVDQAVPFIPKF